jgi:hypothetical protein
VAAALWSEVVAAEFWSDAAVLLLAEDWSEALGLVWLAGLWAASGLELLADGVVVLAAAPVLVEGVVALAALWSDALVFGFTGFEYEGEVELALLDGCAVVEVADWSVVELVLDWAVVLLVLVELEALAAGAAVLAAPEVAAADWSVAGVWLLTGGVAWAALCEASVLVAGAVVLLAAADWSADGVLEEAMPGFAEVPLALLQVAETVWTLCSMMLSLLMLELFPVVAPVVEALLELEADGVTWPVMATVWLRWSFSWELSPVML